MMREHVKTCRGHSRRTPFELVRYTVLLIQRKHMASLMTHAHRHKNVFILRQPRILSDVVGDELYVLGMAERRSTKWTLCSSCRRTEEDTRLNQRRNESSRIRLDMAGLRLSAGTTAGRWLLTLARFHTWQGQWPSPWVLNWPAHH